MRGSIETSISSSASTAQNEMTASPNTRRISTIPSDTPVPGRCSQATFPFEGHRAVLPRPDWFTAIATRDDARPSARVTLENCRCSYEIGWTAARFSVRASTSVSPRDTDDAHEMRAADYELSVRRGTAHHIRAQRGFIGSRGVSLWNHSRLAASRRRGAAWWHMRCAYQDVVADVPWRVAAFETEARVITAMRLKGKGRHESAEPR